ncbi:MAG: sugar transferase [Lachnospiraceae bacterium]|nr:sugar transferase [Lachnospiraceae bacterium]
MSRAERAKRQQRFDDIKHTVRKGEGLLEVAVLSYIYYIIWRICYGEEGFYNYLGNGKYVLIGVYALLVFILFLYCDSFQYGHLKIGDVVISQCISMSIVNFITYFQLCLMANKMINALPMLGLCAIDFFLASIFTFLFTIIYHHYYLPRHMAMVYGNENAITLKVKMDSRSDKYKIDSLISIGIGFQKICEEIVKYDAVVINDVPAQIRNDILKFCYQNGIRTYVTPKLSDIMTRGADDITLFDTPLLLVKGQGLSLEQRFVKRTMDIVLCLIAMIPATPIMLIVAAAIKLEDRGPVFYRQKRVTKDGRVFDILKFRSMIVNAEKEGRSIPATDHDPRITRVGKMIRATRIDELPQILNILSGSMSVVGPRPERTEHMEKYSREIPEFVYRTKVKGGLTGFAQIYGKYNTSAYDKLRLDLMYIENYSLLLDIKLILMTIRIVFKPEATEGFDKVISLDSLKEKNILTEEIDKSWQGPYQV